MDNSNYFVGSCRISQKYQFIKYLSAGWLVRWLACPLAGLSAGWLVLSVKKFTIDPDNEVCTLLYTPYKENEKNRIDKIMFLVYIYSGGKL